MLDGERREMRIRHEITIYARQCQELAKYYGVTLGWLGRPGCFRGQPARHLLPCRRHDERPTLSGWLKSARTRAGLAMAIRLELPTQLRIQPIAAPGVQISRRIACVHKNVCIDEDHLDPSPSRCASASATCRC